MKSILLSFVFSFTAKCSIKYIPKNSYSMVKDTNILHTKGSELKTSKQKDEGTKNLTLFKDVTNEISESSNNSAEFSFEERTTKIKNEETICCLKGSAKQNVNDIYTWTSEKCKMDGEIEHFKDLTTKNSGQKGYYKLDFETIKNCSETGNSCSVDNNDNSVSSDDECSGNEAQQLGKLSRPIVATSSEDSDSPKSAVYDNNLLQPINYKVSSEVCSNMSDGHSYSPMSVYDRTSSDEDDDCSTNASENQSIVASTPKDTNPEKTDNDANDDDFLKGKEESKNYFKYISNVLKLDVTEKQITDSSASMTPLTEHQLTKPTKNLPYSPNATSIKSSSEDSFSPLHAWKRKKPNFLEDTDSEIEFESVNEFECKFPPNRNHQRKSRIDVPAPLVTLANTPNENRPKYFVSDFDQMLQKKRAERSKSHSNRNLDFITKNDDLIEQMIDQMEEAAYQDRCLNEKGLPATKKVAMLKYVTSQLIKKDLQQLFLEHNILSTLTEWLSPLPSKCLPCVQIRESILRILADFPTINSVLLKESGIGKALMYLRKHPEETKANRERCNRLISQWARPIHNLTCDYRAMSKKERQERDVELSVRFKKQISKQPTNSKTVQSPVILDKAFEGESHEHVPRPGERGWVPRARVPQPSTKDYVRRPQSELICEISTKIKLNRYELLAKKYQTAKRTKQYQRSIVGLSVFGSKM